MAEVALEVRDKEKAQKTAEAGIKAAERAIALKPTAELRTTPPRLLPARWQPGTFAGVIADPEFRGWLAVSTGVAAASTALVLVAAVPAAYYTSRRRFRARRRIPIQCPRNSP